MQGQGLCKKILVFKISTTWSYVVK